VILGALNFGFPKQDYYLHYIHVWVWVCARLEYLYLWI